MNQRVLLSSCAAMLLALASSHASACGRNHQYWPKGATVCISHHLLECQDLGAWHKLPGRCEADTPPPAELNAPDHKTPAADQGKTPPNAQKPTTPSSN